MSDEQDFLKALDDAMARPPGAARLVHARMLGRFWSKAGGLDLEAWRKDHEAMEALRSGTVKCIRAAGRGFVAYRSISDNIAFEGARVADDPADAILAAAKEAG